MSAGLPVFHMFLAEFGPTRFIETMLWSLHSAVEDFIIMGLYTVTLKQTDMRKKNKRIAAAVYLYQADNDGEWGELRFDFESNTAEIVKLADWDTVKSNIFAKTAIRFVQRLPEARMLKSVVVPFWKGRA